MKRQPHQPRFHWTLLAGFLIFSVIGWMRMVDSIRDWYWLSSVGVTPGPLYLAITGGVWGLIGLVALAWLYYRLPWCRLVSFSAALLYAVIYWVDVLFIQQPASAGKIQVFPVLATLLLLLFAYWVIRPLDELRQAVRR